MRILPRKSFLSRVWASGGIRSPENGETGRRGENRRQKRVFSKRDAAAKKTRRDVIFGKQFSFFFFFF
ncbi:MAG: hypothetical protein D6735_07930 [Acidobacteria bacterium]|nr:MAG: hypothetical protein D6735_07930 [Acidobacteriota bacterium]